MQAQLVDVKDHVPSGVGRGVGSVYSVYGWLLRCRCDFVGTVEFLRKLELDNDSLTKSIIGTIGDVDSYQLPDSKGRTAFMRHILNISDAERQERREQILGTSLRDFRSASCRHVCEAPAHLLCRYQAQCFWRIHDAVVAPCHAVGVKMCLQIFDADTVGPCLCIVMD